MNVIASMKNPALVSRFAEQCLASSMLIDKSVHAGETLAKGTLLGRKANGKARAYAEGTVKSGGAFSTSAATFTLDVAVSPIAKHFRVGDAVESVAGVALGTIASYNPATGVGTLSGNSAAVLAAGGKIRVPNADLALDKGKGRVLADETAVTASQDEAAAGYFCGYFLKGCTSVTDAALAQMGGYEFETGEIRLV